MPDSHNHEGKASGFTLLEVMIAVLLLGLSYVAVLESFSFSLQRLVKLEQRLESFINQDAQLFQSIKFNSNTMNIEESEEDVFLEGSEYVLVIASSEGGLLQTLKLQKK